MFDLDISIVIAQIINFLILFVIFKKFIADYLNDAITKREEELEKINNSHLYYEQKVKEANIQSEEIMTEAKQKADSFMAGSEKLAKNQIEELLEKANREAMYIIELWKKQLEKDKQDMMNELKDWVLNLSLKLNKKLFDKETVNKDFIKKELDNEKL